MPDLSITISANSVAWYAAIVATFGLIMTSYNIWRDRSRLKITIQPNNFLMNTPQYEDDCLYLNITVRNIGRRPTKTANAALKMYGEKRHYLLNDSILKNVILNEENPRTNFILKQEDFDVERINYVIVYDEKGKSYKKYLRKLPLFWKIKFWLKNYITR